MVGSYSNPIDLPSAEDNRDAPGPAGGQYYTVNVASASHKQFGTRETKDTGRFNEPTPLRVSRPQDERIYVQEMLNH